MDELIVNNVVNLKVLLKTLMTEYKHLSLDSLLKIAPVEINEINLSCVFSDIVISFINQKINVVVFNVEDYLECLNQFVCYKVSAMCARKAKENLRNLCLVQKYVTNSEEN